MCTRTISADVHEALLTTLTDILEIDSEVEAAEISLRLLVHILEIEALNARGASKGDTPSGGGGGSWGPWGSPNGEFVADAFSDAVHPMAVDPGGQAAVGDTLAPQRPDLHDRSPWQVRVWRLYRAHLRALDRDQRRALLRCGRDRGLLR